jgi:predicted regulator of Ras-like GTPase activity (Roadblock/LC7/MglB family)
MDADLKIELDKVTSELAKTDGVDGGLIVDINGEVLSHYLLQDLDIDLFGPMTNVITGSSERLIDVSNHGKIERVLVESQKGKALFLHLGNVHFIVLMANTANVGMVMIASKRAAHEIVELTRDLTIVQLEELEEEVVEPEPVEEEIPEPVEEIPEPEPIEEEAVEPEPIESTEPDEEEVTEPVEEVAAEEVAAEPVIEETEIAEEPEAPVEEETEITEEPKEEEPEVGIPVIRPPIAFPKPEKVTEIPEDDEARVDLLLKIYESIFLAMSIGASKIMGVAPARGLTRKFLPVEECKILLDGVDVKNNSSIDFVKIKGNADKIPLSEREKVFKESFGKIITIITENYGKVMGYAAFKGMIRPEFKIINESYGPLLDDLGVKEQLHPELLDFFN